jgi:superfamily I DNA/RNA helicase
MAKIKMTDEQRAIVKHTFKKEESVVIKAFAGAGKTSTMRMVSKQMEKTNPDWKILYLAFNKAIQKEAEKKFGDNVECRTTHSLAYEAEGSKYRHKLNGSVRLTNIVDELGLDGWDKWNLAKNIWFTVAKYIGTDNKLFDLAMVPFDANDKRTILTGAQELWKQMKELDNTNIPMTHDGYLKLYQLSNPQLQYDMIIIDEAQDSNPTVINIINKQTCSRVWVGDEHQAIYQFRGSSSAFKSIKIHKQFTLSESFRFGSSVAGIANQLLGKYKGETVKLTGSGGKDSLKVSVNKETDEQLAIINRTNALVFENAVYALKKHIPFHIIGGTSAEETRTIEDAFKLYTDDKQGIRDPLLKKFKRWADLEDYVKNSEDPEYKKVMELILKYKYEIPDLLRDIKTKKVTIKKAKLVLSTVHKCKGLEFDAVKLENDFVDMRRKGIGEIKDEEINLMYVALTRAKKQLLLNDSIIFGLNLETKIGQDPMKPISSLFYSDSDVFEEFEAPAEKPKKKWQRCSKSAMKQMSEGK